MGDDKTIREFQADLPWGLHDYSAAFRARTDPQRDAGHALVHITKAAGKLAAALDRLDHTDFPEAMAEQLRDDAARALADLYICTTQVAKRWPARAIEMADAVAARTAEIFIEAPTRGGGVEGRGAGASK